MPRTRLTPSQRPASDTAWMAAARCRAHPPDVFFPADGAGVAAAQKICAACPVSEACLAYALDHHIDQGVWGGASERRRRRLARARLHVSSVRASTE